MDNIKELENEINIVKINSNLKEIQKDYNKKYYEKNKEVIKAKLFMKESCAFCNRQVNHQRLYSHQQTDYCRKHRDTTIKINDITNMRLKFLEESFNEINKKLPIIKNDEN